jgi:hypothetical protein
MLTQVHRTPWSQRRFSFGAVRGWRCLGGVAYYFAPGEGSTTQGALAELVASATTLIQVASMVLSSGPILQALVDQINAGLEVIGVYDGPEMAGITAEWAKGAPGSTGHQHAALWEQVKPHLTANTAAAVCDLGWRV